MFILSLVTVLPVLLAFMKMEQHSTTVRLLGVLDRLGIRPAHYGVVRGARIEILYKVNGRKKWYKGTIVTIKKHTVDIWFDDGQVDVYDINELEGMERKGELRKGVPS